MRNVRSVIWVVVIILSVANVALADIFGTGETQFTIDFVDVSGDASSANGTNISSYSPGDTTYRTFTDPGNNYRMGTYEITNDQWNKFTSINVISPGHQLWVYGLSAEWTGIDVPTNNVSWYEAAQFVNWLNTSTGHQAAYKFTGTQGTDDYTYTIWESGDGGFDSSNPYRNSNAYYFLPTEDEWVKTAYWNGTSLQTFASAGDVTPTQSDWNFYDDGWATDPAGPWDVGNGSEELNGTFDMMGNVCEWMESPYWFGEDYLADSDRGILGGSYNYDDDDIRSSYRRHFLPSPNIETENLGFRVASVPEPCSLVLLSLGGLMLRRKYRR